MPLIRILHASDFHISTRPGVISFFDLISAGMYLDALRAEAVVSSHSSDLLYHMAEFLYEDYVENFQKKQAAPIDAVMLTGDIATTGRYGDLQLALKIIDGPALSTAPLYWAPDNPTLAGSTGLGRIPLWLLPGNHDRLKPDMHTRYAAGGGLFDNIFQAHWGPMDPGTLRSPKVKEYPGLSREGLTVKVFAADFTLKTAGDRDGLLLHKQWAQGRVYPEILRELVQKTTAVRSRIAEPLAILWALHFPPKSPRVSSSMKLIDQELLIQAAELCEVDAMLAGHTHEPVWYRTPGARPVFCSGTTTQKHTTCGNFFHILNIETDSQGDIVITPDNYVFDQTNREFIPI